MNFEQIEKYLTKVVCKEQPTRQGNYGELKKYVLIEKTENSNKYRKITACYFGPVTELDLSYHIQKS